MSYYFIYPIFALLGKLPEPLKNLCRKLIYCILYKVWKYRLKVVRKNLKAAFPEKSETQLIEIEEKFYRQLSDVFTDTMTLSTISEKNIRKRVEYINAEQIEKYTKNKSYIVAMAHYGSWELTTNWSLYSQQNEVCAVYRPIHDKGVNRYFLNMRKRFGVTPVPMDLVGKKVIESRQQGKNITLAMIADQTPPYFAPKSAWFDFMGQKTPFFTGMEKLAVKYKMPIAYLHVDKFENQHYKMWFEIIYDGTEEVEDGEITKRYIDKLQATIKARPELWMWSHNRWKHDYRNARD